MYYYLYGNVHFNIPAGGELVIDNSGYWNVPTIRPVTDWYGALGTSTKHFNTAYINHLFYAIPCEYSDSTLKTNFRTIESPLEKLKRVKGYKYDIKPEFYKNANQKLKGKLIQEGKNRIGLTAQNILKVFPELVFWDDSAKIYAVNYTGLIPVIIEALKEQQVMIDAQNKKIQALSEQMEQCCNSKKSSPILDPTNESADLARLDQNAPNPFSQTTEIRYFIPENSKESFIFVYDMTGLQLKEYQITTQGEGSISIHGSDLKPGMYLYSLIIDKKEIDTKRMILTKN